MRILVLDLIQPDITCLGIFSSIGKLSRKNLSYKDIVRIVSECKQQYKFHKKMIDYLIRYPQLMEHSFISVLVLDAPSFVLNQLARHRHISVIMESRRISQAKEEPSELSLIRVPEKHRKTFIKYYKKMVKIARKLEEKGVVRELAQRLVPPIDPRCAIISGNMRAWVEMLAKRICLSEVQIETRRLALAIAEEINKFIPGFKKIVREYATRYLGIENCSTLS